MTNEERHIKAAYQRSGLGLLGLSYAQAMRIKPIRLALQMAAQDATKGQPLPVQPSLI